MIHSCEFEVLLQRIFTITPQVYVSNPGIVQNQLSAHSLSVRERVQDYLDAGSEISTHQAQVTHDAWTGSGYIAIDPQTGAGVYLIDGGSNGGILLGKFVILITVAVIITSIVAAFSLFTAGFIGALGLTVAVAGGMFGYASLVQGLLTISTETQFNQLTGGIAVAALGSIALGALGKAFYDVVPSVPLAPLPGDFTLTQMFAGLSVSFQFMIKWMFG